MNQDLKHKTNFAPDPDSSRVRYEIHFMATAATGSLSAKDITQGVEQALEALDLTPEMALVKSNEGHDEPYAWVDGERVGLGTLVAAYRLERGLLLPNNDTTGDDTNG